MPSFTYSPINTSNPFSFAWYLKHLQLVGKCCYFPSASLSSLINVHIILTKVLFVVSTFRSSFPTANKLLVIWWLYHVSKLLFQPFVALFFKQRACFPAHSSVSAFYQCRSWTVPEKVAVKTKVVFSWSGIVSALFLILHAPPFLGNKAPSLALSCQHTYLLFSANNFSALQVNLRRYSYC